MPGARQRRIHRARETLRDARLLLDQEGSPESVINRSYYAMFYAVLAKLTRQIEDYRNYINWIVSKRRRSFTLQNNSLKQ